MLDKKQIWVIFLFEFKMGRKAVKTMWNINNPFGSGLLMNVQCSGDPKSFAKETRVLKSVVASHQKVTTINWEPSSKLILLQLLEKLPKLLKNIQQRWPFYCHSAFEANWERWKNSISGWLMSWQEIFCKSHLFETPSSLILFKNKEKFLDQIVTHSEKWILYYSWQWLAQLLDQEAPKHFPKPNQKRSWSLWWSVAHLIHYSFLNLSETITYEKHLQQINEMHQNCNAYSWHWSTKWKWKWSCSDVSNSLRPRGL